MTDTAYGDLREKLARRATEPLLPVLRLQRLSRLSPLGFGLLCTTLIVLCMLSPLLTTADAAALFPEVLAAALFFGASLGIIAGFSAPVLNGAAQDLKQLASVLPWSSDDLAMASSALTRLPRARTARAGIMGCVVGLLHSYLLNHHLSAPAYAISQYGGTTLLWVAMFWTIPPLTINALVFSSLGRIARPDLLRPSQHAAFGSAALRPALLITALLCTYALLLIGGSSPLDGPVLIGFVSSFLPLLAIVALPLRGIRRRIREQRQHTLAALDQRLDAITQTDIATADADTLFQLDAVLDMRERVARAPSWPFDVDAIKRILLYIVLPPLTWAAAAIVEMMINGLVE